MSKVKNKPDALGYYWARESSKPWRIVEVLFNSEEFFYRNCAGGSGYIKNSELNEWIGPIVPECVEIYKTVKV